MSETALTVPTAFQDIAQLADGFADRVDEDRLMLYGPEPVDQGAMLFFAVTLEDGSHALEGAGEVVACIDGGEERPEVARFDILIGDLQLDGASQAIYERILMTRSEAFADQPATGEVSLAEVEQVEDDTAYETEESTEVASIAEYASLVQASAGNAPAAEWSDDDPHSQETVVGDAQDWDGQEASVDIDTTAGEVPVVSDPGGLAIDPTATNGGVLARPSLLASWAPEAIPTPEARPEGGVFAYSGGLPIPPSAPRPELDPAYRISPAPRPGDGGAAPQVQGHGDAVDGGVDLEVAEELEIDEGMVE